MSIQIKNEVLRADEAALKKRNFAKEREALVAELDQVIMMDRAVYREKRFQVFRELLKSKESKTLTLLINQAFSNRMDGKRKSVQLFYMVFRFTYDYIGKKKPETVRALNNLADSLCSVGQYEAARDCYLTAYHTGCEVNGEDDLMTLTSMNGLAYTYGKTDEYQKAVQWHRKAYEKCAKSLGESHHLTLICLFDLARACGKNCDDDEKQYYLTKYIELSSAKQTEIRKGITN